MSKEKDQHINVFVRIKPVSTTDTSEKCATTVVEMVSDKEITVYERSQDKSMKVFTFDGVFGPSSTQMDVYSTVISPLLKEVIAGYNCTVFAYGQTGTGKTYTMEGDRVDNLNWQSGSSAGMIPRCLSHLFDELQKLENQQYTVRVNFLELYNEELLDLLTDGNDSSKIKLYEDVTKKGSVIVHGLDEVTVRSKAEIYKILEKGSERRKTAATMLNTHSSRSHTVFTITIHTKENTSVGEELLKTAKLNLVDLAGSEHVGRSGAVDKRAREAKSINQSLLTLGRVITALVEKAPHIPYRESKLTRLLQESLGGRTKTSIIATVSSVSHSLEETLSTLDYAHRAKNITNCPEINQKVCRKALLKEYTNEIERLKRDLLATREKNGIYVPLDDYDTMQTLIGHQRKEINKKKDYCKTLEEVMENKEKIFNDLQSQYDAQVVEVMRNTDELKNTNYFLQRTKECLRRVERDKNERKQLAEKYAETEKILLGKMGNLLSVVTEASQDAQKLHDKLDLKRKVEEENEKLGLQMKDDFTKRCRNIEDVLLVHKNEIHNLLQFAKDEVETRIIAPAANIKASIGSIVDSAVHQHFVDREESKKDLNTSYTHYQKVLNTHMKDTNSVMENENKLLTDIYSKLAPDIHDLVRSNYNESLMQHLQYLNRNISQKLESVSMYTKHAVETVCRNRLEEYNYLRKSLSEISEHINGIARNEKQVMENYKEFGKKMEDLSCGFNLLDKCEGNYSGNIDTSHQIDQVCNNVYDQNSHNCNADITKQNDLNDFLQNITSLVKSDIDSGINQAEISNKTLTEKGNILVCDLQERLSTGRAMLTRYNNNVQSSGEQLQQKMIKDKDRLFASSANSFKAAKNMDLTHIDLMKKQKNKISDFSRVMDNKITNQHMELNNFNNNIVEELRASQQQIDKFLSEDIRRDIRTGTTPEKKEFSYPRELAVSPPGQIIQRFRESREHLNGTEDNLDSTTEQIYLLKVDNMEKPPNKNRAPFVTSTPYNNPNAVYLNNCSSESIFPTDLPGSSES